MCCGSWVDPSDLGSFFIWYLWILFTWYLWIIFHKPILVCTYYCKSSTIAIDSYSTVFAAQHDDTPYLASSKNKVRVHAWFQWRGILSFPFNGEESSLFATVLAMVTIIKWIYSTTVTTTTSSRGRIDLERSGEAPRFGSLNAHCCCGRTGAVSCRSSCLPPSGPADRCLPVEGSTLVDVSTLTLPVKNSRSSPPVPATKSVGATKNFREHGLVVEPLAAATWCVIVVRHRIESDRYVAVPVELQNGAKEAGILRMLSERGPATNGKDAEFSDIKGLHGNAMVSTIRMVNDTGPK